MIAGNDTRRDFSLPVPDPPFHQWDEIQRTQSALSQKAIGFNCINASRQSEPSLSRHFLPTKDYLDANCSQIRLEVMFPSCWDGVTNGDPGVHLRYPDHIISGICPVHFPIRIPSLLYETYFQTSDFRDIDGAFYLANHDNTGMEHCRSSASVLTDQGLVIMVTLFRDGTSRYCGKLSRPALTAHGPKIVHCSRYRLWSRCGRAP